MRIHAGNVDARNAAPELFYQLFGYLLGLTRYYLEFERRFKTARYDVAHARKTEHLDERHKHGRKPVLVNERRNEHDYCVEHVYKPRDVGRGKLLLYEHRDYIRSARRPVYFQHHSERNTAETARRERREHGLAVLVNLKIQLFEYEHARRRNAYRRARLDRKILTYQKERKDKQRRIDDERRPRRGKSRLVLDHRGNTRRSARRKVIRQREHLDAHRPYNTREQNNKRNDNEIIEPFILEESQRHSPFLSRAFTAYCNIKPQQMQVFATTFPTEFGSAIKPGQNRRANTHIGLQA